MADMKYPVFFFKSMFKLAAFIVCCSAVRALCLKYIPYPLCTVVTAAAAALITWFFLDVIERRKRSFFAMGYILENIVPGATWGILAGFAGYVLSLVFKHSVIKGLPSDFDIKTPFFEALGTSFFIGVVFFGYFFHILQSDFGIITAIVVTSVIYGCINALGSDEFILSAILAAFPAAAAGVMILHLGDMRSAVSFLTLLKISQLVAEQLFTKTVSFEFVFAVPAVSAACMASMLYAYAKEKTEGEKRIAEVMELRKKRNQKKG